MNAQDIELWTPLHAASRCGHLDLVKLLISQGADIAILNSDNQMPYEISETSFVLNELQKAMQQQGNPYLPISMTTGNDTRHVL